MDRRAWQRFRANKGAMVGLAIVGAIVVFALVGPWLSGHDPNVPDFEHGRGRFGTPLGPSARHWLGTDTIFRDELARLASGGRLSLEVALVATVIAIGIGTAVGVASGYFQGERVRVDRLLDASALGCALVGGALGAARVELWPWRLVGLAAWAALGSMLVRTGGRLVSLLRGRFAWVRTRDAVETGLVVVLGVRAALLGRGPLRDRIVVVLLVAAAAAALLDAWRAREQPAPREPCAPRVDVDDVLMRGVDVLLAFPFLLLLMALGAAIERTTLTTIFLVLGLTAWTGTARVIRSKTLQVRDHDFVVASRALGQSTPRLLVRHVLPNVAGLAVVLATNGVAALIVAEAALAFLGLSLPPPAASWGRMLDEGRSYFDAAPWLVLAPGLAILLAVLGFNLLGEGLRDVLDPKE